ncbi:septal ring lytic transglycosylase RlpA family protein [Conexibacter arvalis]|uniref:Rare lipoprotein A (Peptidoglycan hydrolase) n=1 Tax=Conexibacter arvalis TaxID=912552 RepID=A0A840IK93_9ACTN|nr:septal ring lytic transglycosylase RlpA family protein [Conexibacter arvalis]MBB4664348.1 rare lipoprotein A (peptidoglycan hydrolase) [Conexibacter arvalis]
MIVRRRPVAFLAAAMLAVALPAGSAHAAMHGGASADAAPAAPEEAPALTTPLPVATASANGITISSNGAVLLNRRATVSGSAPARLRRVAIQQLTAKRGWQQVATATISAKGSFKAAWRPRAVGAQQLRAVAGTVAARAADEAPQVDVTVYRPGVASWYGPASPKKPGKTACGVPLTTTTLGVAHKTLRCGTQVQLYYRGATIVVPVIDRGPFITGRTWDLTKATAEALGDVERGLITVGALPLNGKPRLKTPYDAPAIRR